MNTETTDPTPEETPAAAEGSGEQTAETNAPAATETPAETGTAEAA